MDTVGASTPVPAPMARGVGLTRDRWTEVLRVSGADRARFLHGYLTCDVTGLAPGSGAYGFFTSAQGKILADAVVAVAENEIRLTVPRGRAGALVEHLERYVLADRVELSMVLGETTWLLAGAGLAELAEAVWGGLPETVGGTLRGEVAGSPVDVVRRVDLSVPVCAVHGATASADGVSGALRLAGAEDVAEGAFEALRVAAGVPRYGADFDERHFPQETGIEHAVSYTKGCYLGQEIVARIHYRGHVNHVLRALVAEGGEYLEPGVPLQLNGEEVGWLGSVARTPAGTLGLAILHRKVEPGSYVLADGAHPMRVEAAASVDAPASG